MLQEDDPVTDSVVPGVLSALARIAINRDWPGDHGEGPPPPWIGDLAYNAVFSDRTEDYLRHNGLIVWSNGWQLTAAGWNVLEAAEPLKDGQP